jgi:hypothetical protein
MSCSCKKVKKLGDKYGVEEKETLFGKCTRMLFKTGIFLITIVMGLIITPIVLVVGLFKTFFMKKKRITIPMFLTKYKKSIDGQKL